MKKIPLYPDQKQHAIVDDIIYDWLMTLGKWRLSPDGYAVLGYYMKINNDLPMGHSNRKHKIQRMHRYIMWPFCEGLEVDHINGDRLDNRRENLRECTRLQNSLNVGIKSNNKSGHTGVIWDKGKEKWMAYATVNKKRKTIGRYDEKKDAIEAREEYTTKHFGQYKRSI